jgi:1,4-alpha-glucan branching enzyme
MHDAMRRYVRSLNRIYAENPALWAIDDSWDGFRWLNVDDAERSSIAFMRRAKSGPAVVCACNFTPVRYDKFVIGLPEKGVLDGLLNSDDKRFGGGGVKNAPRIRTDNTPFLDLRFSAKITLPPMSAVWFRFETEEKYET